MLSAAGWDDVVIHQVELPLYDGGAGATVDEAVAVAMGMSGLRTFLDGFGEAAHPIAADALRSAYAPHHDGTGVRLDGAIAIICARRLRSPNGSSTLR